VARILAAAKDAGVTKIDHLITTHFHIDHVGGLAELAGRIPIQHFVDHGPNVQANETIDRFLTGTYPTLYGTARRTVAKAGDQLTLPGLEWRIVSAAGKVITNPLAGAGAPNPACAGFKPHTVNPVTGQPIGNTEDEQSVGSYVKFGQFRFLYLADLPWNHEFELMCPSNRLGTIDLLLVSRHGQHSSNSETLVHGVRPRVAVMNNGIRKGGQPETMRVLFSAPRLEDIWQMHVSELSGQEYTAPGVFIANDSDQPLESMRIAPLVVPQQGTVPPAPVHNGPAFWIKVAAQSDGAFTVTNARNGFSKTYR
jgi:hypothetical protein